MKKEANPVLERGRNRLLRPVISHLARYIKGQLQPGTPKFAVQIRQGIAFDDAVRTIREAGKEEREN